MLQKGRKKLKQWGILSQARPEENAEKKKDNNSCSGLGVPVVWVFENYSGGCDELTWRQHGGHRPGGMREARRGLNLTQHWAHHRAEASPKGFRQFEVKSEKVSGVNRLPKKTTLRWNARVGTKGGAARE